MMTKKLTILLLFLSSIATAQENPEKENESEKIRPFIAYELGQAIFNDFKSYSAEAGIQFRNNHLLRLTHMNTKMSETHLSSDFVVVVDGDHVEGLQFGFETFYDFPVLWKGLHLGPSLGWYHNEYHHKILDESLEKSSVTVGLGISYREVGIFGVKGLYYTLTVPLRTHFDPIQRTKLGDTVIKANHLDSNIFFYIGYQF